MIGLFIFLDSVFVVLLAVSKHFRPGTRLFSIPSFDLLLSLGFCVDGLGL